jgi:hypothetical protein
MGEDVLELLDLWCVRTANAVRYHIVEVVGMSVPLQDVLLERPAVASRIEWLVCLGTDVLCACFARC